MIEKNPLVMSCLEQRQLSLFFLTGICFKTWLLSAGSCLVFSFSVLSNLIRETVTWREDKTFGVGKLSFLLLLLN